MDKKINRELLDKLVAEELENLDEEQLEELFGGVKRRYQGWKSGRARKKQVQKWEAFKGNLSTKLTQLAGMYDEAKADIMGDLSKNAELQAFAQNFTPWSNTVKGIDAHVEALKTASQTVQKTSPEDTPAGQPEQAPTEPPAAETPPTEETEAPSPPAAPTAEPEKNSAETFMANQPAEQAAAARIAEPELPSASEPTAAKAKQLTPDQAVQRNIDARKAHNKKVAARNEKEKDDDNFRAQTKKFGPTEEALMKKIRAIMQEGKNFKVAPTHKDKTLMRKLKEILKENKKVRIIKKNG